MKKYKYWYAVYTNNLCHGKIKLAEYPTRTTAEFMKNICFIDKYGCCDVVKIRHYI